MPLYVSNRGNDLYIYHIMTSNRIVKALRLSKIDINDITIDNKKTNKMVPIAYKGQGLFFQTPFLETNSNLKKTAYPHIYQLDTLFQGDTEKNNNQWFQFIEDLENHLCTLVELNGTKWFTNNNIVIKTLIKESNEGNYVKWPIDLQTNIFVDENKNSFDPQQLKSGDLVMLIIEVPNIWINDNQFGITTIIQKVLVKPYTEKIRNEYEFDDSVSDNEDEIVSLLATEQKSPKRREVRDTHEIREVQEFDDSVFPQFAGLNNLVESYVRFSPQELSKLQREAINMLTPLTSTFGKFQNKCSPIITAIPDTLDELEPKKVIKKTSRKYTSDA